ncbi:hypothetical protein [Paraburkholderia caledonica]|uniref:Uncharacterized protein n=1 Tax=Paraburkholderia caledonica TaxID=134536 RepID=A0AB73IUG7_9BURK|nr:hypothetical protein [Paraburkholderia caledonica]
MTHQPNNVSAAGVLDVSVLARLSAQIFDCPLNPTISRFARAIEAHVRASASPQALEQEVHKPSFHGCEPSGFAADCNTHTYAVQGLGVVVLASNFNALLSEKAAPSTAAREAAGLGPVCPACEAGVCSAHRPTPVAAREAGDGVRQQTIDNLISQYRIVEAGDLVRSSLVATEEAMRDFAAALLREAGRI